MYYIKNRIDNSDVEDICYDEEHIAKVLASIKENFDVYFQHFIETTGADGLSAEKLRKKFGVSSKKEKNSLKLTENYKTIIRKAIDSFEEDRDDYVKILDIERLEDYEDDATAFKSKVLKNECPIIRKTLNNSQAKELDKYRAAFKEADADKLLEVVYNLCVFGNKYAGEYNPATYENANNYHDLGLELLDTADYTAYRVIGGGIKTHMLYKVHPAQFPNRSRNALWALWYLSGKGTFGCLEDSEFLMIDGDKDVVQHNYFYPYQLFAFYAFEIYKLLRDKAAAMGAYIDTDYRYVIVDAFFEYVGKEHEDDIAYFKVSGEDGKV